MRHCHIRGRESCVGFRVDVHDDDGRAVVRPAGEVDLSTAPVLTAAIAELLGDGSGSRTVVVDLSEVSFLDSSGVAAIAAARRLAREGGSELVLRSPPAMVAKVLDITGMSGVITVELCDDQS